MESLTPDSKEIKELQQQFGDEFVIDPGQLVKDQSDPAFYCDGYGHSYVASITDNTNGNMINIYCDGEMRVNYEEENGDISILRHCSDLLDYNFCTDEDLKKIKPDDWTMNPWFDMYLGDEWIDNVHFDVIKEGFPFARELLLRMRSNNESSN